MIRSKKITKIWNEEAKSAAATKRAAKKGEKSGNSEKYKKPEPKSVNEVVSENQLL